MVAYTQFTASLQARAWKQHSCFACGCVYRYLVSCSAQDTGGLEVIAHERAAKKAVAKLQEAVEARPCPTCGLVQPEMAGKKKESWHALTWFGFTVLGAAAAVLAGTQVVPFEQAAVGAAAVAGGGVLLHLMIAFSGGGRGAGLRRAQAQAAAGTTVVVQPGDANGPMPAPRRWTARQTLGTLLSAAAGLAFLYSAHVVATRQPPDDPTPNLPKAAPGRPYKVVFENPPFKSVEGRWSATPTAVLVNYKELGLPKTVAATSNAAPYADSIRVEAKATNETPKDLFANVIVPDDPKLGGKTLKFKVTLNVVYPVRLNKDTFDQKVTTVSREVTIRASTEAEIAEDRRVIQGALSGIGAGFAAALAGAGLLVWGGGSLKKQGAPSEVVPLEA
jgi:hypothetical protein